MTCFKIFDCYPVENVVWTLTRHASSRQSENVLSKFPRRFYWKPLTKHNQNQITRSFTNECKTWGKPHVNVYKTRPNQNALKTWSIICLRPCCWVTEAKRTLNQMTCFGICDCCPVESVVWTFARHAFNRHSISVLTKFAKRFYWKPIAKHYENQIACFSLANAKHEENPMWTFTWHLLIKTH